MANVDASGVELLGPDGVLAELTRRILERGLSEELSEHLGYGPGDTAGRGSGNNRNGTTPKTVLTEIGAIDLDVPRDRNGDFEPQLVPKGARRLERFNQNIVHVGIGLHTPATVHYGTATEIRAARAETLTADNNANPARFRHGPPTPPCALRGCTPLAKGRSVRVSRSGPEHGCLR